MVRVCQPMTMSRCAILCFLLYLSSSQALNETDERPNILVILSDDMGIGDLSCYGVSPIKTPNIDSLAENGIRFNRMYSQPVCTPSRAALLTGRLPVRNGFMQGKRSLPVMISPNQEAGFQADELTMQKFLKQHHYSTSLIGKWHLGMGSDNSYLPTKRDFDHFIGIPMVHIEPCSSYTHMDVSAFFGIALNKYKWVLSIIAVFVLSLRMLKFIASKGLFRILILFIVAAGILRLFLFASLANPSGCLYMRNEEILEQPYKDTNMTLRMTSEVLRAIENHSRSESDEPMFLHINYLTPHYPALVSHKFNGSSGLGPYYDSILEMDWSIGLVLKALEKHGMKNNLIYFASDNGPAPLTGFSRDILPPEHLGSTLYRDSNGKTHRLRGWKGSNYEGGIRMPCLIQWSGKIVNPGRTVDSVTSQMDVLPTIMDIVDPKRKPNQDIDGESLMPYFKSKTVDNPKRIVFHYCTVNILGAVSYDRFKLHFSNSTGNYTCSGNIFKQPHLYDLHADPSETVQLSLSEHREVLMEIYELIKDHEKTLPAIGERISQFDSIPNPFTFPCSNFPSCTIESKVKDDFSNLPL